MEESGIAIIEKIHVLWPKMIQGFGGTAVAESKGGATRGVCEGHAIAQK
jgi:hypothetical protein